MVNKITKLRNINIKKFRGLQDVSIDFGERITIICGKNGTSKSTILGVIAQAFSFRKDYTKEPVVDLSSYKTLIDKEFASSFSDHFRFSEKYDIPGSMDIELTVYDGASETILDELSLGLYDSTDRRKSRPILRGNHSRNVTHPLIYLSLERLLPISSRPKYLVRNVDYVNSNKDGIRSLSNKLLIKDGSNIVTATTGTIDSLVVHSDYYDQESVSVGEDNVGQIIQAIYSFKRLKEVYPDYHGGIILIDEADAGLFPAAQVEFISILSKATKEYNLQIIMTSHSPTIIEEVFSLAKKDSHNYKTIYLTDTFGKIQRKDNFSWPQIFADLRVETISIEQGVSLPVINVYFEDREGADFFSSLITDRKINKVINPLKEITLGCNNYKELISKKIPEFSKKSIIVFDADVPKIKGQQNVVLLPSGLPPDQLLFEFLYNLPIDSGYWHNDFAYTKAVFLRETSSILQTLNIIQGADPLDLKSVVEVFRAGKDNRDGLVREMFKKFYKDSSVKLTINGKVKGNPFRLWAKVNQGAVDNFQEEFKSSLIHTISKGNGAELASVLGYLG
ncbi:AAA family ATPase [Edaphovirga cremea]|uniref:AAA family ATPase n=1 Tax=Edaphovirga cremea TaxID=2267246 RepID=UPI000DEEE879|nr:AAA family ATPase [Edaphovirga cremea]